MANLVGPSDPKDGDIMTNGLTRLIWQDGQWQPYYPDLVLAPRPKPLRASA